MTNIIRYDELNTEIHTYKMAQSSNSEDSLKNKMRNLNGNYAWQEFPV